MNTAISGSRTFTDREFVEHVIDRLLERGDGIIIGDAPRGVDFFAFQHLSQKRGIRRDRWSRYIANWNKFGKMAGVERNARMIKNADQLIAIFADGLRTPGTSNAVEIATSKGIPIYVFHQGAWLLEGNADLEVDRWLKVHSSDRSLFPSYARTMSRGQTPPQSGRGSCRRRSRRA